MANGTLGNPDKTMTNVTYTNIDAAVAFRIPVYSCKTKSMTRLSLKVSTKMAKTVRPRLSDPASCRGGDITQPWTNFLGHLCTLPYLFLPVHIECHGAFDMPSLLLLLSWLPTSSLPCPSDCHRVEREGERERERERER